MKPNNEQLKKIAMYLLAMWNSRKENGNGKTREETEETLEEKSDKKIKVFVIFDPDHDKDLRRRLSVQAKNRDSSFELFSWSDKGLIWPWKGLIIGDWKTRVRKKIMKVDKVIVICGLYTDVVDRVSAELKIAREEGKPYFLLEGYKDEFCEKPKKADQDDKIYRWTPENLKRLLKDENDIPIATDSDKKVSENLINRLTDVLYGSHKKYQDHLLEQYKLYVEMTDRNSARRQKANTFFLSINTALIGLFGYLIINGFPLVGYIFSIIITIVGLRLNSLWHKFIYSYRDLNAAKYRLINKIEKFLPLNLYDMEWKTLGRGETLKSYSPHNSIEISIICSFKKLYSLILIFLILWKIL